MITHYDLFAGIGGFSLPLDEVFNDHEIKHIFCEWEQFPTAVLKQHWTDAEYYGDIADLVADTKRPRWTRSIRQAEGFNRLCGRDRSHEKQDWTILTGGFPCQPFSAAGRRKGTADDRYKWPEMFEVIRNVKPEWVIAENVRGLVTWNDGMVLEQVCTDLESEGYEVQPFIIPAVAVNAPHRRDRIWIIAHAEGKRHGAGLGLERQPIAQAAEQCSEDTNANDTRRKHGQSRPGSILRPAVQESEQARRQYPDWERNWQEVAFATCNDAMDDGIPRIVDGVPQSFAKWRQNSLKAYGNGIVHQVAIEILKAVRTAQEGGE